MLIPCGAQQKKNGDQEVKSLHSKVSIKIGVLMAVEVHSPTQIGIIRGKLPEGRPIKLKN